MRWDFKSPPPPPPPPPPPSPSRNGYVVLINSRKYHSLLKRAVAQYATCTQANATHVVCNAKNPTPASLFECLGDIAFSWSQFDDDVIVPCATLDFAFAVWQSACTGDSGGVCSLYALARSGWWPVWWMHTYSIVLPKAAFFHKKYLEQYTYNIPSSIQDYVSQERNCEGLAISFLIANATGAPPNWIEDTA